MDTQKLVGQVESKVQPWLSRAFNAQDLSADVKPVCFVLVILVGLVLEVCQWKRKGGLTTEALDLFKTLALLVGGGGAVWTAVDKWKTPVPPSIVQVNPPILTKTEGDPVEPVPVGKVD